MSFEEYMNQELPNYKEVLSIEKITQLKRFYEKKENFRIAAETNLKTATTSNIDKTNRYENAMKEMIRQSNILKAEIEHIKNEINNNDENQRMTW